MPPAPPDRLTRKTTSLAELLARRVRDTPDREAYRYPVGVAIDDVADRADPGDRGRPVVARPRSRGPRRHPVQHARRVAARRPRRALGGRRDDHGVSVEHRRGVRLHPRRLGGALRVRRGRQAARQARRASRRAAAADQAGAGRRRAGRGPQGLGDHARRARGIGRRAPGARSARDRRHRRRDQGRAPRDLDLHLRHHGQAQGRATPPRVLGLLRRRDRRHAAVDRRRRPVPVAADVALVRQGADGGPHRIGLGHRGRRPDPQARREPRGGQADADVRGAADLREGLQQDHRGRRPVVRSRAGSSSGRSASAAPPRRSASAAARPAACSRSSCGSPSAWCSRRSRRRSAAA